MTRIRIGYLTIVAGSIVLNGWALMQHLDMLPAHAGFIAAVLIVNMLITPLVVWASFVFGEVAMGPRVGRRRRREVA
jgi:hypothetical protein